MNTSDTQKQEQALADYRAKVDRIIGNKYFGLGLDDLPDCNIADWFEEGLTPGQAARLAIQNARD